MTFSECKKLIKEDYKSLPKRNGGRFKSLIINYFFSESFIVTTCFRLTSWLSKYKILEFPMRWWLWHVSHKYGISLSLNTDIKGGFCIHHFSNIVITPCAHIGEKFTIYQGCTIGAIHEGAKAGHPIIGNNVTVYAGSKIIGQITIGNNVIVGANSVVNSNIPDNCVVAGVPARVLRNLN